MMTLDKLKEQTTSNPNEARKPRINKEPIEEQLKKIAHNSAHPGEAKWKRSVEHMKMRKLAEDYRYPGRINAHTMEREFGVTDANDLADVAAKAK